MTLETYLRHRRIWETAMVLGLSLVLFLANVGVASIDYGRGDLADGPMLAVVLMGTSHVAFLVIYPLVLWFDDRFPLRFGTWKRNLPAHLAFSVVFSALHVLFMYYARVFLFPLVFGHGYHWDNVLGEFTYEYLKDFRTYLQLLALIYLYRFVLLRLQGEAGFVGEGEAPPVPVADRFLVKKLGREFLVRTDEIEWIESAGNYVNLHVSGKVYPLRGTMVQIAERLAPVGFIRVHRQAIVNADLIAAIEVFDSGDGELTLTTDARVPVSRRYRQQLRDMLVGEPSAA